MKYESVVGNPPYAENKGVDSKHFRKQSYTALYENALSFTDRFVSMIIPARWLQKQGCGTKYFNERMMNYKHISELSLFIDASRVFPGHDISGGVCILACDTNTNFDGRTKVEVHHNDVIDLSHRSIDSLGIGIFVSSPILLDICNKVYVNNNNDTIADQVESRLLYGLRSDFAKRPEKYNLPNTYTVIKNKDDDLSLHCLLNGKRSIVYLPENYPIPRNKEKAATYRVLAPKATGASVVGLGYGHNAFVGRPIIAKPREYTTETYMVIWSTESEIEANNFVKYYNSKFFSIMVSVIKSTQNMTSVFDYVPNQDFSDNSDIDWNKDVDKQLYDKYGLNEQEIDFIEKSVRIRS